MDPQAQVNELATAYGGYWRSHEGASAEEARTAAVALAPPQPKEIRLAARGFTAGRAAGFDGVRPRLLAHMSDAGLDVLAQLLCKCERFGEAGEGLLAIVVSTVVLVGFLAYVCVALALVGASLAFPKGAHPSPLLG